MGNANLQIMVLNGWAASPHAWDLCAFMRASEGRNPVLYSYIDQLDGLPERAFEGGGRFLLVGWSMEDRETGWRGMSPMRLEALRRGLELTHGQGFFGIPEGRPNPYIVDSPENLERGLKYLREIDVREQLVATFGGGCAFPVHIFQSECDGIVRSANVAYLQQIFPKATVTLIPGSEHALPIAIPEAIDAAVEKTVS